MSKTAFLFPGQGAQVAGMGADVTDAYPAARMVYEKANDVLGYDVKTLCFNGPEEKLAATDISQPAIFVTSAALLAVLRSESATPPVPDVTAGLSLGEYTALYAAGILDFEDALQLVQQRGRAMQAAAEASDGAMVSVIGLEASDLPIRTGMTAMAAPEPWDRGVSARDGQSLRASLALCHLGIGRYRRGGPAGTARLGAGPVGPNGDVEEST